MRRPPLPHRHRHQHWILFDPPITYAGHPISGLWLDEQHTTHQLEAAYTLDAARQPLDVLTLTSYVVGPVE